MRALVFLGPASMRYCDVPDLEEADGEVLIRVEASGICGSDMHGWHGQDPRRVPPLVMGHEAAGSIIAGRRAGERVVINPLLACTSCDQCVAGNPQLCANKQSLGMPGRPGAFADIVRVPARNAIRIPDSMSFSTAALVEPVAVSYHAANLGERLLRRPISAMRALVIGVGAIGLAAALVLRARNAGQVLLAGTNPLRRKAAAEAGIEGVFDPASQPVVDGSVDLVIDAVGSAASRAMASRAARFGGAIVHLGLLPGNDGLDMRRLTLGEIAFSGSFCYDAADFRETVSLLDSGRMGDLSWVEERPMAQGPEAFAALDRGEVRASKIILRNFAH
ncbi:hypothetical protein AYJ54_01365 [Bradyrhizobium centrolobii]|uniref:Enoyl reductase (ER) domain-containing protein n=1 Tax=Bradyrhizobium centrolobii TaxID=1505087 RepID=A0A176YG20_9BRAD|nr:alcohol dehydrogenase catalytic domain-containing protein [Bradyrhizobium centrolobii]OAF05583.1 hypothetical protein AYJ54_01365 [Bradyrhizobium centrolobii]